jgi:hypothetical protein
MRPSRDDVNQVGQARLHTRAHAPVGVAPSRRTSKPRFCTPMDKRVLLLVDEEETAVRRKAKARPDPKAAVKDGKARTRDREAARTISMIYLCFQVPRMEVVVVCRRKKEDDL